MLKMKYERRKYLKRSPENALLMLEYLEEQKNTKEIKNSNMACI